MRMTSTAVAAVCASISLLAPVSAYAADGPAPGPSTVPAVHHSIDPKVSFSKDCHSGITVILSNIAPDDSTTDPVTFHVTAPSGRTSDVVVQPNQLVKVVYGVAEGETANVGVDTLGLSHQTFRWTKRCTRVLGEKVTQTPQKKPTTPSDPPASAAELPFTGVPAAPLTVVGLGLLVAGAGLVRAGRVRRA